MESDTPPPSPRRHQILNTTLPQSTLRQKAAELFKESIFSSSNPFEADTFEFADRRVPTENFGKCEEKGEKYEEGSVMSLQVSCSTTSPFRHAISPKSTAASSQISTLRRKTEEIFSATAFSSNVFEPDEDEFEQQSPYRGVGPSTLRRKTDELFSGCGVSSNPFDADEDELEQSTPIHIARDASSFSLRVTPAKRAEPTISISRVSVEAGIAEPMDEKNMAVSLLAKQHVEAGKDSTTTIPRLSTLKRESSELLAQQGNSSMNLRNADEDELVRKLETMRLNPTRRIRGNLLKSLRNSTSSLKDTSPLRHTAEDKEKITAIWDAEDDEFDRWPDKQDLTNAIKSFTTQRGTFNGALRSNRDIISSKPQPHLHTPSTDDEEPLDTVPRIRGSSLTEQEHSDLMHELLDKNCGNPHGPDAHDEILKQFYQRGHNTLPHSYPAGYMHLLDQKAYLADQDTIVQMALPRLADAVATVLHLTSPACLASFLNPQVHVFEWRRDGNCLMIRREGTHVVVGTYHNFGTCYIWTYFVKSTISGAGAWKEEFAGASQISTPISARGVEFERMVQGEGVQGVDPTDEKYALHMGRLLGRFLLNWSVWDFRAWRRWVVEWEVDGVVVNAREWAYEEMRMARDEED
ncbi:hypothetical protein BDU57DRAFT_436149 [Ampelomyces quisqualis]|uniref:Uncharacterized protein n=1 Tax=Ampelomyces quisqualis TaxID=50730 RepID=A0A6A5R181_AMPQU|nr:hypothetical protein BDU57DRAFT_436149 [Ampelomyces quisqualis]